jgi:parallel beta-helix repeat protein
MDCRLIVALCLVSSAVTPACAQNAPAESPAVSVAAPRVILEITADTTLDPQQIYGAIVVRRSGVTIDGQGAWLVGAAADSGVIPKDFRGTAILADGVSDVTLRNVNARGWETGLVIRNGSGWLIENCNFSDNFHDPDFGWGENGRRGGIVLDRVTRSTLLRNRANRVWDGCVLVDSSDNLLVDNDFSNCSNTCLKLWTASRNSIRRNQLSGGIRIAPGEVHARDSTSVLIESGSCDNSFLHNNCTRGGDGIFIRVLNGWCSTGNYFEGNDCSYANNNGIECWAPRNTFVANRANHCSYGFWLGGSDQTRLIGNEASFNGLPDGFHNSPHLPDSGHAGIVFMFGPSSHTIARGNSCVGNHGAGIALVGDQPSGGQKWKAWHWILEGNLLHRNRWGIYGQHADWITLSGNQFAGNTAGDVYWDGNVQNVIELDKAVVQQPQESSEPKPAEFRSLIRGPRVVRVGEEARWFAEITAAAAASPAQFTWKAGDRALHEGPEIALRFDRPGFQRIGLNALVNGHVEPAWVNLHVVDDRPELGTEHGAAGWAIADFHERLRSDQQVSRGEFSVDTQAALAGREALRVKISPYSGFRTALTWPADHSLRIPANDRLVLSFWLKAINSDVTGWQGGPFIVLHGAGDQRCYLEPATGRDLMRELEHNEERETWRRLEIPLAGDKNWVRTGDLPREIQSISCCFDSWGAPPLTIWLDGLAIAPAGP